MPGGFSDGVQIFGTDAAAKIQQQRFPGRRGIQPDRAAHHFREKFASPFDLPKLFVGIKFQSNRPGGLARKKTRIRKIQTVLRKCLLFHEVAASTSGVAPIERVRDRESLH